jgi:predicted outer membrane repeat protein
MNVTFFGNTANANGGAIYNTSGTITITNSILYGDSNGEIFNQYGMPVITYSIVQGGYDGDGNLNADPLLDWLQNNGGYTQTMALGEGSPAIDAGDPNLANCPEADQRGMSRPQGAGCDLGAYEYPGASPTLPAAFSKFAPTYGTTNVSISPTISWNASDGAVSYEFCIDPDKNNNCDSSWISAGADISANLSGLSYSTSYSWQVHALNADGSTAADNGTWWHFATEQSSSSDTTAPIVDSFDATPRSDSLAIYIEDFSASDDVSVTGYLITESPQPPSPVDPRWSVNPPQIYRAETQGLHLLYPWAKDAAGNVSSTFDSPSSVIVKDNNCYALSFDGSDDYVSIHNSTSATLTLEAWIKTSAASLTGSAAYEGNSILYSDQGGDANDFTLAILNDRLSFWDGANSGNIIGNTSLVDGQWHHIAVVRQAGASDTLYVDGNLDGTTNG